MLFRSLSRPPGGEFCPGKWARRTGTKTNFLAAEDVSRGELPHCYQVLDLDIEKGVIANRYLGQGGGVMGISTSEDEP